MAILSKQRALGYLLIFGIFSALFYVWISDNEVRIVNVPHNAVSQLDVALLKQENERAYDSSTWHECVHNTSTQSYSTKTKEAMDVLFNLIQTNQIKFYVVASWKRRPRFFNAEICDFPFETVIICPDFYYITGGHSLFRDTQLVDNCTFGRECQFSDVANVYTHLYQINKAEITRDSLKWIFVFEDDVNLCPDTPQYMLNVMNLSTRTNINLMHLSRGAVGTMIKTSFIPKFVDLVKEAKAYEAKRRSGNGFDVILTWMFDEKNEHFDVYYSRYNMMHHPLIGLNPEVTQHVQGKENVVTCDKIGKRWQAKQLNYVNPYDMTITFEHLK
eukprot:231806_1